VRRLWVVVAGLLVSPPVQAFAFFLGFVLFYIGLSLGEGDSDLTKSVQWSVWKLTAASGLTLSIVISRQGVRRLKDLNLTTEKISESPSAPTQQDLNLTTEKISESPSAPTQEPLWGYLLAALLLTVLMLGFLSAIIPERTWSSPSNMNLRVPTAIWIAGAAVVPWLALVWLAYRAAWQWGAEPHLDKLLALWDLLNECVVAFTTFVVIALISTGALRNAWFASIPKPSDQTFPATDVLFFGAFFAAGLAAITVPLVAAWRRKAQHLLDTECPLVKASDVTKETIESRERLEGVLHLDVSLLRSPLTAFSIFTPLITAALAAFIPELAN
jgi:hypothetical protein